jgi:nicotinamide-nucleotide amidase
MRAYVLSIGSELMLGHLTDTNATFLAQDFAAHGIDLIHVTHVGDNRARIVATLRHALALADLVVCTGGIGPTDDDLTREAISDVLGQEPTLDPALYEQLASFFAHRGQPMPQRNAKQAWLIPAAEALANPIGTAPGWYVRLPGDAEKVVVAMPGVPREMHRMWREQALPRILPLAGATIIDTVTLKTIGIGESAAEQVIHDLVAAASPVVATYAKDDGVHIRVTAIGDDAHQVRFQREQATSVVRERLGEYIWGEDGDTLASVLLDDLAAAGVRLSITEIGTGGSFISLLSTTFSRHGVVLGSSVLPVDRDCADSVGDLAVKALRNDDATLGLGIVLTVLRVEDGRVDGHVTIAVAKDGADAETLPSMNVRASIPDAHRRAALHAADTLRRWLTREAESAAH